LTARPSMASPTGTWAILPVAVTDLLEFHGLRPLVPRPHCLLLGWGDVIVPSSNSNTPAIALSGHRSECRRLLRYGATDVKLAPFLTAAGGDFVRSNANHVGW